MGHHEERKKINFRFYVRIFSVDLLVIINLNLVDFCSGSYLKCKIKYSRIYLCRIARHIKNVNFSVTDKLPFSLKYCYICFTTRTLLRRGKIKMISLLRLFEIDESEQIPESKY